MPRRRPARVRAGLPRHPRRRRWRSDTTNIDGLSAAALAEVRRAERRNTYLMPGKVGSALKRWKHFVHKSDRYKWAAYERDISPGCPCCEEDDPWTARELLESAMRSMSRRRARELRRLVTALDERC